MELTFMDIGTKIAAVTIVTVIIIVGSVAMASLSISFKLSYYQRN
jgi:hypothetical protein